MGICERFKLNLTTHTPNLSGFPRQAKTVMEGNENNDLVFKFGHEELTIRQRYETLSIINDFFIAIWFLAGSVLFLYPAWEQVAVWLFIIGSAQFLIRPALRLAHQIHLKRLPASRWDM